MLTTTLTNAVRAEVALAWLEAPDVASLEIEENDEPTFAETMAAIVETETERVSEDPAHADRGIKTSVSAGWTRPTSGLCLADFGSKLGFEEEMAMLVDWNPNSFGATATSSEVSQGEESKGCEVAVG